VTDPAEPPAAPSPGGRRRLDPDTLAELEEQRDFLLRSLDDLEREHDAGELDEDDYEHLRDDYTRRAADVIRSLEDGRAAFDEARAQRASWARRLAVLGVVALLGVGAGYAVAQSSGSRMPGDTFTGSIRETVAQRLQRAAQLAATSDVTGALEVFDEVLEEDPDNVEALSERGLLLVSVGQGNDRPALYSMGVDSIERAIEIDPDYARAHFYLGLTKRLRGDPEGADESFDRALAADPSPQLRQEIEQFRAFVDRGGPPPGGSGASPGPVAELEGEDDADGTEGGAAEE
jgi:tetratricopeptide (TPR) repeat protein